MSKKTSSNSPVLIDMSTYDFKKNLIFGPVKTENVPGTGKDGKKPLTYRRINISTKFPGGGEGQLIFDSPGDNHFCFGIKEFEQDGKVNGRTMGFSLYDKDGPTEKQRKWVENFEAMIEYCKEHLVKVREELAESDWELEIRDLKKFNPLYWPTNKEGPNKGKRRDDQGPSLSPKIWESKGAVKTVFHETYFEKGRKRAKPIIDPLATLTGAYCNIRTAILFDSIYLGNSKSPQLKHYHVVCSMNNRNPQPILDVEEDDEDGDEPAGHEAVTGAMLNNISLESHEEEKRAEEDIPEEEEGEKPKKTVRVVSRKKKAAPA